MPNVNTESLGEQVSPRSDLHSSTADGNELNSRGEWKSHNNESRVSGPDTIPPFNGGHKRGPAMFALGVVFEDASLRSNQQWVEWISRRYPASNVFFIYQVNLIIYKCSPFKDNNSKNFAYL